MDVFYSHMGPILCHHYYITMIVLLCMPHSLCCCSFCSVILIISIVIASTLIFFPIRSFGWLLRERSEVCKVCHPQFSNGILLPVNWRVHVFKLPVMIDLVSDEVHTVAKSLKIYSSEIRGL